MPAQATKPETPAWETILADVAKRIDGKRNGGMAFTKSEIEDCYQTVLSIVRDAIREAVDEQRKRSGK